MQKKIMLVFGTRPEAIKMAPLVHALRAEPSHFEVNICITGQHRQLLDQVLKTFNIVPDINLDLMKKDQDLFDITANVLVAMKNVFKEYKPNIVIVHGDTSTALSTAIAGFYAGIPIAHVEAGLRSNNLFAPFPEEFNRQTVSKIAQWHFTPTKLSREHLLKEKIADTSITVTGNTVIDSLQWVLKRIDADTNLRDFVDTKITSILPFDWRKETFVLITGHRRENFGDGLQNICNSVRELSLLYPKLHFVYSVHLNPNVQQPVNDILTGLDNVHLLEPINYDLFVYLLKYCHLVLTDSGGIQEEAPSLGKPVLVMRDVTERPEAVSAGTVKLVGTNKDIIVSCVSRLLTDTAYYKSMSKAHNPYGDGNSCSRIVDVLRKI
tara:strand:- start:71 stop:1210 length:1140 start_codon:yes stop_codon:yes gene_type:complete